MLSSYLQTYILRFVVLYISKNIKYQKILFDMQPSNSQREYLRLINNIIINDIQIQNIILQIRSIASFIRTKKIILNINQAIIECIETKLYYDLVQKLQNLRLSQKNVQKINKPFPSKKIYFNQLSLVQGSHSIALLLIPKGLEFSLHDHINMLVLTKVMFGEVQIESLDTDNNYQKFKRCFIEDFDEPISLNANLQKQNQQNNINIMHINYQNSFNKIVDKFKFYQNFINSEYNLTKNWKKNILRQSQLAILTPSNGNIHRLYAKSDCILIDILLPDYVNQQHCHYYEYTNRFIQNNPIIKRVKLPKQAYLLADLRQLATKDKKQQQGQSEKELKSLVQITEEENLKI